MRDVPDVNVDEPICGVPHRQAWASAAHHQAGTVRGALADLAQDIQHIGSTAVPGLAAKPVLDRAVAVDLDKHDVAAQALSARGFHDLGDAGTRGRRYLRRREPDPP